MKVTTYFSKRDDVQGIILDHLGRARSTVNVAVAWFTDTVLFEKLIGLQRSGIAVRIVITDHEFNHGSRNDYKKIVDAGGYFGMLGDDRNLMHMKFCTIDDRTVISGSANWTYSAFNKHDEQIILFEDSPQQAAEYTEQFETLREIIIPDQTGVDTSSTFSIEKAFSLFDIIRSLINLNRSAEIEKYTLELTEHCETAKIGELLQQAKFSDALFLMQKFKSKHSGVFAVSDIERHQLLAEEKFLLMQLESLNVQIVEAESILDKFTHYIAVELNPLYLKIIELKRKHYAKLKSRGYFNKDFEDLDEEFRERKDDMEREQDREIPKLSDDELLSVKEAYKKAAKLCHPDSSSSIFKDRIKAESVFAALTNARREDDLDQVLEILSQLEKGETVIKTSDNMEKLRARIASLKHTVGVAAKKLGNITSDPDYITILSINDWPDYFGQQRIRLERELADLHKK